MTYNKFCEYNNLQDLLKVNYGRDIFKGNFQNQLSLPYQTYSLYKFNRRVLRRNTYKINILIESVTTRALDGELMVDPL